MEAMPQTGHNYTIDSYSIERCSAFRRFAGPKDQGVFVCRDHNMVFSAWGTIANNMGQSYQLLTFDHHADTHEPFASARNSEEFDCEVLKKLHATRKDFSFEDAFRIANYLRNDEQIKTAVKYDYLHGYLIICDMSTQECGDYQMEDRRSGYTNAEYRTRGEALLALKQKMGSLLEQPLIIDFDLDFFRNEDDFSSELFQLISPLLKAADAITIATEPDHFNQLKTQSKLSEEMALKLLLRSIDARIVDEHESD